MKQTTLFTLVFFTLISVLTLFSCQNSGKKSEITKINSSSRSNSASGKGLTATSYFSGFDLAHDTYNTITTASDGRVYYCLSSQSIDTGGQYYVYDPKSDKIEHLGDITEICGEAGSKPFPRESPIPIFMKAKGNCIFLHMPGITR